MCVCSEGVVSELGFEVLRLGAWALELDTILACTGICCVTLGNLLGFSESPLPCGMLVIGYLRGAVSVKQGIY